MTIPSEPRTVVETDKARRTSPADRAMLGVLVLGMIAMAAKVYCASTTIGTSDILAFFKFGWMTHAHGISATYGFHPDFNHPPLAGWYAAWAYSCATQNNELGFFAFLIRLPGIAADFAALCGVLWLRRRFALPGWGALALYAASPVAFMVSGYHGNSDSVVACFAVLAAVAAAAEQPLLCGVCLGLACNIKIVPLFLIPAFFFFWLARRKSLPFSVPLALCLLAGYAVPLWQVPGTFLKNVFGYSGLWGNWGIPFLLEYTPLVTTPNPTFLVESKVLIAIGAGMKLAIVVSALTLAWRRRAVSSIGLFQTLALSWAVFFVFAPGFGVQYLVWAAPFFLISSERWYVLLTTVSAIALFVFYNASAHGMPWYSGFRSSTSTAPYWLLGCWGVFLAYLLVQCWSTRRSDGHSLADAGSETSGPD